jgi:hypothetical protein
VKPAGVAKFIVMGCVLKIDKLEGVTKVQIASPGTSNVVNVTSTGVRGLIDRYLIEGKIVYLEGHIMNGSMFIRTGDIFRML